MDRLPLRLRRYIPAAVLVLIVGVFVWALKDQGDQIVQYQREGCQRGNAGRDSQRFILTTLATDTRRSEQVRSDAYDRLVATPPNVDCSKVP